MMVAAVPASDISAVNDLQFINSMTAHLTRDLELARTAEATAQLPALKSYAAALITERQDQLDDLTSFRNRLSGNSDSAPQTRTVAPSTPRSTSDTQVSNGSDRGMLDQFIRHHQTAIQLARAQSASGKDAELNAFARRFTYSESAGLAELRQMRAATAELPGKSVLR